MKIYSHYGFVNFILALGYKSEVVKDYFLNYREHNSDFTIDLYDGSIKYHKADDVNWKVSLVETGINTMTGGRLKHLKDLLGQFKPLCLLMEMCCGYQCRKTSEIS